MPAEKAIQVTGLQKRYGENTVLDSVDLEVEQGSVFALLGPNGAGKTTMVRILATLTRADGGEARVGGFDVVRERRAVRRIISLTGQFTAVDETQTGAENLTMMGKLSGLPATQARTRTRELLEQFELTNAGRRRVGTYSGGMRRRLDLAASLVAGPEVIFLDEPTTGLDPRGRAATWNLIASLSGSGITVFLTTQYLEEADQLADHIALLDRGRVVAAGTSSELKSLIRDERLDITFADTTSYAAATATLGPRALHTNAERLTVGVATDGTGAHVRALLDEIDPQRCAIERFAVHEATLDDVFMTLTGHRAIEHERELDVA